MLGLTDFSPESTRDGTLPPFEIAKVHAFARVIERMEEMTGEEAHEILGMRKHAFIASEVTLKGGDGDNHPTERAVQKIVNACRDPVYYPSKGAGCSTGRPPVYNDHVKTKCAEVAMELKRKNIAPTPRRVRARLPNLTLNPNTGKRMCDKTLHGIYSTMCFDENEDDPWQYLASVSQDILPSELLPRRQIPKSKHQDQEIPSL